MDAQEGEGGDRAPVSLTCDRGAGGTEHDRPAEVVGEDVMPLLVIEALAAEPAVDLVDQEAESVEVRGHAGERDRAALPGGEITLRDGDHPACKKVRADVHLAVLRDPSRKR